MKVREITCKSALSVSRLPGLDYALNPYRGCGHGCIYCYAPAVLREDRDWGTFVDVKRNMPVILSKEARRKKKGVVGLGTVTDPYQPVEKRFEVTRRSLKQLLREDFPICIQTKSDLVLRDVDLIKDFSDAEVGLTVTFPDEEYRKVFEPGAPPIDRRLEALKELRKEGIGTWAFIGPILPHVTTEEMEALASHLGRTGVERVLIDKLNLKKGTWNSILDGLRRKEPGLHSKYSSMRRDPNHYRNIAGVITRELESMDVICESAF